MQALPSDYSAFMILIAFLASIIICLCYGYFENSKAPRKKSNMHIFSTMQCPSCNELMETGFLIAPEGITWSSELPILQGENLFEHHYRVTYSYVNAYLCKRCGIIKYLPLKNEEMVGPA